MAVELTVPIVEIVLAALFNVKLPLPIKAMP